MREVEKFRLDRVGLDTHSKGSGTSLLEGGWTLFHSRVADSERRWAGVAIRVAPQLSTCMLEFTPVSERVASLRLWVGGRMLRCFHPFTGRLPGKSVRARSTWWRPLGRPRTRWRDYVSQLAWERLRIPSERTG